MSFHCCTLLCQSSKFSYVDMLVPTCGAQQHKKKLSNLFIIYVVMHILPAWIRHNLAHEHIIGNSSTQTKVIV